jgi:hypothetical protein
MTDYYDQCIRHPRRMAALINKLEAESQRLRVSLTIIKTCGASMTIGELREEAQKTLDAT